MIMLFIRITIMTMTMKVTMIMIDYDYDYEHVQVIQLSVMAQHHSLQGCLRTFQPTTRWSVTSAETCDRWRFLFKDFKKI